MRTDNLVSCISPSLAPTVWFCPFYQKPHLGSHILWIWQYRQTLRKSLLNNMNKWVCQSLLRIGKRVITQYAQPWLLSGIFSNNISLTLVLVPGYFTIFCWLIPLTLPILLERIMLFNSSEHPAMCALSLLQGTLLIHQCIPQNRDISITILRSPSRLHLPAVFFLITGFSYYSFVALTIVITFHSISNDLFNGHSCLGIVILIKGERQHLFINCNSGWHMTQGLV